MAEDTMPGVTPATGSGTPGQQNPSEPERPARGAERTQQLFARALSSLVTQPEAPATGTTPAAAPAAPEAPNAPAASAQELPADEVEAGQGSAVLSNEDGADDEVSGADDKVNAAFARIKGQRKEARDKAKSAEQKLADTQAALRAKEAELDAMRYGKPPQSGPERGAVSSIETITDLTILAQKREQAELAVDLSSQLLARMSYEPEKVAEVLEQTGRKPRNPEVGWQPQEIGEELTRIQGAAREQLRAIPQRAQYLHQEAQAFRQVAQLAPELSNPESPVAQGVAEVLQALPQLRQLPNYPLQAYIAWLGLQQYRQLIKPPGNGSPPAAAREVLPTPPRTPGVTRSNPATTVLDGLSSAATRLHKERSPQAALAYASAALAATG